jgi:hypothetical protein
MNRAERRRSARQQEKPKTYVLTEDQINKMKMDAVNEATRKAFLMFLSIPVMILHDKFGFGKQRLSKLMDYALIWFEAVQNNEVKLLELVNIAKDECGIDTINWEATNDNLAGRSNRSVSKK